jgi:DNA-binding NarL/FixJ family response regulator
VIDLVTPGVTRGPDLSVDPDPGSTYVDTVAAGRFLMEVSLDAAYGDDPRRGLQVAAEAHRMAERQQETAVRRARVAGLTWAEIATHLGVSKQAAHRKYRGRLPGRA